MTWSRTPKDDCGTVKIKTKMWREATWCLAFMHANEV
jgi:hypothetical protein